jgi:predicted permease
VTKRLSWALVLGGYVVAVILAFASVFVSQLFTDPANDQASAGMGAFGDAILFCLVFGAVAVLPTLYALYLILRRWRA